MPAQFDDLPTEIKLEIFKIAASSTWSPRVVEIYFKDGQIYSKTLPPPLLHVCQISREVVLKLYKPWLPQFKGTVVHEPWEKRVAEKGVERLSRLQNVCVNLEHDVLLINDKQWSPWDFGPIERSHLRRLAVNLGGWFGWLRSSELYMQFAHLRHLNLFDRGKDQETLSFKIDKIEKVITKAQKADRKNKGRKRKYVAPVVSREEIPTALGWQGSVEEWITYKYSKGYKCPISGRRRGRPRRREAAQVPEPEAPSVPGSNARRTIATRSATKRKRTHYEPDAPSQSSRNTRRVSQEIPRKFVTYNVEEHQTQPSRPETPPQLSADEYFAKIRGYMELFRSPSPEPEPLWKSPASLCPVEFTQFQNPLDKYDSLRDFMHESPGPEEITPTPCPVVAEPRVVFRNHVQDLVDLGAAEEDLNNSDTRDNNGQMPMESHDELDDVFFTSGIETTNPTLDEVFLEGPGGREDLDCGVGPESCSALDSKKDNDDGFTGRENLVFEMPDPLAAEPNCRPRDVPSPEDEEMSFIPKQFMAERKTADGLQFLVQWEDYPEERDWTWEIEAAMIESTPDMVTAWVTKHEAEGDELVMVDYIVEKILGRRKFRGVPHYLVKWKGYEAVKDRTWEPCERLAIDVPLIVEEFEEKKKKK